MNSFVVIMCLVVAVASAPVDDYSSECTTAGPDRPIIPPPVVTPCSVNNGGCAHICSNSGALVTCSCHSGFKLNVDKKACDHDPCSMSNGGCAHKCSNSGHVVTCSCRSGFTLNKDKQACDEAPCSVRNGGCAHICSNSGARVTCSCRSGFKLNVDNKSCVKTCHAGTFGPPGCAGLCHCADNAGCDTTTGSCGGGRCADGWQNIGRARSCQTECAEGWKEFQHKCYKFITCPRGTCTPDTSKAACHKLGAIQAKITSLEHHEFIVMNKPGQAVSVGAHETDGKWRWEDGSAVEYFKWHVGEPNRPGREKCVLLGWHSDIDDWVDIRCDYRRVDGYVCEKGK